MSYSRIVAVVTLFFTLMAPLTPVSAQNISAQEIYDQASKQYWAGRYGQAESSYRTLLETYPNHPLQWDARFGLGKTLFKRGELKEARKHFRAVRRHHPDKSVRGDALFSLVEVAILLDKQILGKQLLQTFLDVYPDHVLQPTARKQLELLEEVNRPVPSTQAPAGPSKQQAQPRETEPERPRLKTGDTMQKPPPEAMESETSPDRQRESPAPEIREPTRSSTDRKPKTVPEKATDTAKEDESDRSSESPENRRISPFDSGSELPGGASTPTTGEKPEPSMTEPEQEEPDPETGPSQQTEEQTVDGDTSNESEPEDTSRPDKPESSVAGDKKQGPSGMDFRNKDGTPDGRQMKQEVSRETQASGTEPASKRSAPGDTLDEVPSTDTAPEEEMATSNLDHARVLYRRGNLSRARSIVQSLLEGKDPGSETHFLAAKIYQELGEANETILAQLNQAIRASENPPARVFLTKSSVLISGDRLQEALATLKQVDVEALEKQNANQAARYHYLRGKIAVELGNPDQAFFHFMDAVRAAPSSQWANKARNTIDQRL